MTPIETKRVGYICMVAPKKKDVTPEYWAPLSYADHPNQPGQDMLLRRGSATMFVTQQQAWDALKDTLIRSEAEGASWPGKSTFTVIEVRLP